MPPRRTNADAVVVATVRQHSATHSDILYSIILEIQPFVVQRKRERERELAPECVNEGFDEPHEGTLCARIDVMEYIIARTCESLCSAGGRICVSFKGGRVRFFFCVLCVLRALLLMPCLRGRCAHTICSVCL